MREAGNIDPGSGAGPFTGQRVSFIPALIAETSARLSFLLRPLTEIPTGILTFSESPRVEGVELAAATVSFRGGVCAPASETTPADAVA